MPHVSVESDETATNQNIALVSYIFYCVSIFYNILMDSACFHLLSLIIALVRQI